MDTPLYCQMWLWERGNQSLCFENAWGIRSGQAVTAERVSVNGERVHDVVPPARSALRWRTVFEDTIIEGSDLVPLEMQWKSGFRHIKARLLIGGDIQPWTEVHFAEWDGLLGDWPEWGDATRRAP